MGEEFPKPGMGVFHSTFDSVHWTGTSLSPEMPVPLGPRKRGQSDPDADRSVLKKQASKTTDTRKLLSMTLPFGASEQFALVKASGIISQTGQGSRTEA
jgi:hypothetical protein